MENIMGFLNACKELGVHPMALFEPDELVSKKNFVRIVYCIYELYELNNDVKGTLSS